MGPAGPAYILFCSVGGRVQGESGHSFELRFRLVVGGRYVIVSDANSGGKMPFQTYEELMLPVLQAFEEHDKPVGIKDLIGPLAHKLNVSEARTRAAAVGHA